MSNFCFFQKKHWSKKESSIGQMQFLHSFISCFALCLRLKTAKALPHSYLMIDYLHSNSWQSRQLSYFTTGLSHHYKSISGLEMYRTTFYSEYQTLSFPLWFTVKWHKTNRYLLRRTSVQSFRRCSSEGGLPCNTQLHFDSAESTLGLGKQAQLVIEYVCRFTGSSQHSTICLHTAHTCSPLQPHYSQTQLSRTRQEITDCIFQPIFKLFNLPGGTEENVHSQVFLDVPAGLVGPAAHPGQEIPWDQRHPCGPHDPCPLSCLQAPWGPHHLSHLSK